MQVLAALDSAQAKSADTPISVARVRAPGPVNPDAGPTLRPSQVPVVASGGQEPDAGTTAAADAGTTAAAVVHPPTADEERAEIAKLSQPAIEARTLTVAEQQEISTLDSLAPITAAPNTTGVRKLAGALDRLGSAIQGAPSDYKRDPSAKGELSFVKGDPRDPECRVTVTADGLIEIKTRPHLKGKPSKTPPAPITRVFDVNGRMISAPRGETPGEAVATEARRAIERARLAELEQVDEPLAGLGGPGRHMTVGELVRLGAPDPYVQTSMLPSSLICEPSWLWIEVKDALDQLQAEFADFEATNMPPSSRSPASIAAFADALPGALAPEIAKAEETREQLWDEIASAQAADEAAAAELQSRRDAPLTPDPAAAKRRADEARNEAARVRRTAQRKLAALDRSVAPLVAASARFHQTLEFILTSKSEDVATGSVGELCNVLSYYLIGQGLGVIPTTLEFKDYYLREVRAGHISRQPKKPGVALGTGSAEWAKQRGMIKADDQTVPVSDPTRSAELNAFLASDANVAVAHMDDKVPAVGAPTHFMLIVKDSKGVWRNADHTSVEYWRRGGITDWSRVYRVDVDKAILEEAKRQLGPPPDAGALDAGTPAK
jgi:hypothetical protein